MYEKHFAPGQTTVDYKWHTAEEADKLMPNEFKVTEVADKIDSMLEHGFDDQGAPIIPIFMRVGLGEETFFIKVTHTDSDGIYGTVDNDLVKEHAPEIKFGYFVAVRKEHILEIV